MPTPMPSPNQTTQERLKATELYFEHNKPQGAYDQAPQEVTSAEEVADAIRDVLTQMPDEEADKLRLLLGEIVSEESAAQPYGSAGNSDRRTLDAARRGLAADQAAERQRDLKRRFPHGLPSGKSGFRKRFPGAARIGHV